MISLIQKHLANENYVSAISICEEAISLYPELKISYWYLGLIFLLQGEESEAQMTWAMAFSDVELPDEQQYILELASILESEADRLATSQEHQWQQAWLIRRHLYEIAPEYLSNLISLTSLAMQLNSLVEDDEIFDALIETLKHTKEIKFRKQTKSS